MENNEELNPNQSFDIWTKIEKIIKPKEFCLHSIQDS